MKAKVHAEVTVSMNRNDVDQLLEDGSIEVDGVTIDLYE